jgi:hydroxylaminobenzene mutase
MTPDPTGRRLVLHGTVLFGLGLLTGFVSGQLANPRMGLSAHLEGLMNGTFLIALGAAWTHVRLGANATRAAVALILFAAYVNWACVLLGAATGASRLMPLAGGGHTGPGWAEAVVGTGLVAISIAMVAGVALVLWGAFRRPA